MTHDTQLFCHFISIGAHNILDRPPYLSEFSWAGREGILITLLKQGGGQLRFHEPDVPVQQKILSTFLNIFTNRSKRKSSLCIKNGIDSE